MHATDQSISLPAPMPPLRVLGSLPTILAPMQDVTTLAFMQLLSDYGAPDYYFTEYFRVYPNSTIDKQILSSITENTSGSPVFAQLLGNSLPDMRRIAKAFSRYPVAGIDLNVGCPAPKIYRNQAGGGLLRNLPLLDSVLSVLRDSVNGLVSAKIRLGFNDFEPFAQTLDIVQRHRLDFLTIHARTVQESYRGEPHYEFIQKAVQQLRIPVYANGNITSVVKALRVIADTGASGVMIGRSAIRNPWIFRQIREHSQGVPVFQPTLGHVRDYIEKIHQMGANALVPERYRVGYLKKYANFIGQGVDPDGAFIRAMRICTTEREFFQVCDEHLIHHGKSDMPFPDEPYEGVVARPNCEAESPE
jgi:tRNA-dihydrouridine synthase B